MRIGKCRQLSTKRLGLCSHTHSNCSLSAQDTLISQFSDKVLMWSLCQAGGDNFRVLRRIWVCFAEGINAFRKDATSCWHLEIWLHKKCYLKLKKQNFPSVHRNSPPLCSSHLKISLLLLLEDGFEKSCSPSFLLWPNRINLSLSPSTGVSVFGSLLHQVHETEFWEVVQ